MEEADIQIAETKKASYEFNRDIIQGSVNAVSTTKFSSSLPIILQE